MSLPRPVWLDEDAEILELLHEVLNRFDRLPGDERQRNVLIPVAPYLRSLGHADAQADQSWALVRELERLGVLRIRAARRNPYDPEWKDARLAFAPASEAVLREWLARERVEPAMQQWRRAVQMQAAAFPSGCEALLARRVAMPGRSAEEIVAAFAKLGAIQTPTTLRQLSAFAFWGDSKVLDERGDLISALFPQLPVLERPIVVAVHLPLKPCEGALFIENQDTYTAAVAGFPPEARSLALIYAAGFRGAATRIRSRAGALLHYAGSGADAGRSANAGPSAYANPGAYTTPGVAARSHFERWWFENGSPPGPLSFWGDLDFAGMQILKSLRARFGQVFAWQPGYEPLLVTLRRQGGRIPVAAEDQGQSDPGATGCAYADEVLLPAIREHGLLDQESLGCHLGLS